MEKKVVAVIFGGESSEYEVSLKSASSVIENLDIEKYNVIKIGITREGRWFRYSGDLDKIKNNTWFLDNSCTKVMISPSKGDREIIEIKNGMLIPTKIDIVFPVLHGKNGEDGTIQGLFEISGIPYVGCNVATSSVCMDKDYAHKIVDYAGFDVPKSLAISRQTNETEIEAFVERVNYPIYVKPAQEGSSIGITKANNKHELFQGIDEALQFDNKVVLEENINGFEVGCAIIGDDDLIVGTVDEIETPSGFFDFKEKYTLEYSKIHLPARIDNELCEKIKATAKGIYKVLGCTGLSRVDLFVDEKNRIIFNEVNTLPGFTTGSRFPNMLLHSGIEYRYILDMLIELGIKR
ncbi:D-alanine--D-serine ligase VanG [Natronincola ferrireducens]|uniref:D-alanine--D-alanine ligase n=1 Tax=Natronincola ferrireducens TaxID=393762 RepID=A0A1G8Z481_9FIRM|nr:D-alanine--D-serine ligase VanG [Natronincola ferrireducens]SDK09777.1 D-alanine---D-serine ligase [Natronincola ferrireducens]